MGVLGESNEQFARIHDLMGQVSQRQKDMSSAADCWMTVVATNARMGICDSEEILLLRLKTAHALYLACRNTNALDYIERLVTDLRGHHKFHSLLVDALLQSARYMEKEDRSHDHTALERLSEAEKVAESYMGSEDVKVVEIKRDIAILHSKLGNHEIALEYLQHVEYFERRLHGS